MPFETPFLPKPVSGIFDGTITASVHEHGGVAPATIIKTDQSWAVNVDWTTTGFATGMICGNWHLHVFLESIGPGPDLDQVDLGLPAAHIIPLTPGLSPVNYSVHFDIAAGAVSPANDPVPLAGRVYKLVVSLTYLEPGTNQPGPMAAYVEGPILQFYNP